MTYQVLSNFSEEIIYLPVQEENLERKKEQDQASIKLQGKRLAITLIFTCLSYCLYLSDLLFQSLQKANILRLENKGKLMIVLLKFQSFSSFENNQLFQIVEESKIKISVGFLLVDISSSPFSRPPKGIIFILQVTKQSQRSKIACPSQAKQTVQLKHFSTASFFLLHYTGSKSRVKQRRRKEECFRTIRRNRYRTYAPEPMCHSLLVSLLQTK